MTKTIKILLLQQGKTAPQLYGYMPMCKTTFYRKMKRPDMFTVAELKRIARFFKVKVTDLFEE